MAGLRDIGLVVRAGLRDGGEVVVAGLLDRGDIAFDVAARMLLNAGDVEIAALDDGGRAQRDVGGMSREAQQTGCQQGAGEGGGLEELGALHGVLASREGNGEGHAWTANRCLVAPATESPRRFAGNPATLALARCRPEALRPRLSAGLPSVKGLVGLERKGSLQPLNEV